jgi:hypothetical protein
VRIKEISINQSLVVSVVINAEFDSEDYGLIPTTVIGRKVEPLKTNLQTKLNYGERKKKTSITSQREIKETSITS